MDAMQRIILAILLFCAVHASAAYVSTSIGDSRIQSENDIYKPGGIIHWSLEAGFFNEPENLVDYKLALGIYRFGYSHSDGDGTVSLWEVYFKPMIWSVTYFNVMLEFSPYVGIMFAASGITDEDDELFFRSFGTHVTIGYEYRLGYQINEKFFVGLTANYHTIEYGFHHIPNDFGVDHALMGGLGLNLQYNLPW